MGKNRFFDTDENGIKILSKEEAETVLAKRKPTSLETEIPASVVKDAGISTDLVGETRASVEVPSSVLEAAKVGDKERQEWEKEILDRMGRMRDKNGKIVRKPEKDKRYFTLY